MRYFVNISETDKQQHIVYSFFILLALAPFANLGGATLLTTLVGVGKEVWDKYYGSGFCWYDMQANLIGILLGIISVQASSLLLL